MTDSIIKGKKGRVGIERVYVNRTSLLDQKAKSHQEGKGLVES